MLPNDPPVPQNEIHIATLIRRAAMNATSASIKAYVDRPENSIARLPTQIAPRSREFE
jgi:hypothetical protein